ncbi:MAG: hypothetical protein NUW00_04430 [Candidatus Kaiserbacteria bacterium]|nr:hypothetical protein [Candidatus Kaiserbacteria bacterium]
MIDKPPTFESGAEKFPSMEKVLDGFEKITGGAEIKVLKKTEDEHGLFVFDVETRLINGDTVECCFKRARAREADGVNVPSRIHTMLYNADGMPSGAGPQYDYIDGEWVEIK